MISDCLIVGSGICGLTAANMLRNNGLSVTVLDKGKGVGGRIATRRFSNEKTGEGVFDYGAQYFTVRDERLKKWVDKWLRLGIVKKWSSGFVDSTGKLKIDNKDRFIGSENMRQITKFMAKDIEIHQSTKVIKFKWKDDKWNVFTENREVFYSKNLILTCPIPQSLTLINNSNIDIPYELRFRLEAVEYDPCIALIGLCNNPTVIPEPGGMWGNGEQISWITDNSKKGIKTYAVSLTVHTSPSFSKDNWNEYSESIYEKLKDEIIKLTGSKIVEYQIHKWRYSQPVNIIDSTFEFINTPGPIYLGGDAFSGPRVEGAFISGYEIGSEIASKLQP